MKKVLKNNIKTQVYLNSLSKIYLVGCGARYGVLEFRLAGGEKDTTGEMIPLVYDYYDGNGTCDLFLLRNIYETTTGTKICWTTSNFIAETIANSLNNNVVLDTLKLNVVCKDGTTTTFDTRDKRVKEWLENESRNS